MIERTPPTNPGSINDLMEREGIIDSSEAARIHGALVDEYIGELATYHGMSREDLHEMRHLVGQK